MPLSFQVVPVPVVDLPAVAVTLVDQLLAVQLAHDRPRDELRRIETEPHGAALVLDVLLGGHEIDHRIRRRGVELGRVGLGQAEDVAGELDDRALEAETQPEEGDALLAGVPDRGDLALDASRSEAAGDTDPVELFEVSGGEHPGELVAGDPSQVETAADVRGPVPQRLRHRQVRVRQVDVLADVTSSVA